MSILVSMIIFVRKFEQIFLLQIILSNLHLNSMHNFITDKIIFVTGLRSRNGRLKEDHIAYILLETLKGLIHLHENHCMHR